MYRKRKGEALQRACGICARSTRRDRLASGEGSTHLRGCGMTRVAMTNGHFVFPLVESKNRPRVNGRKKGPADGENRTG